MTYKQIAKETDPIITLAEVKAFLKVDHTLDDALINSLIAVTTEFAENYMHRDLLTTTYENYRDTFYEDLTLRRGGYQSLEKIEYLSDGSFVLLPSTEYIVSKGEIFGTICEIAAPNTDNVCNSIKITFKAGFGNTEANVPEDIKLAMKMHIAFLYTNRGDCSNVKNGLPIASVLIYKNYKIIDIVGGNILECV